MVLHTCIIHADIFLIACIFLCPARKNTTQLTKYLHVLYAKPSIRVYISLILTGMFAYRRGVFMYMYVHSIPTIVWCLFVLFFVCFRRMLQKIQSSCFMRVHTIQQEWTPVRNSGRKLLKS